MRNSVLEEGCIAYGVCLHLDTTTFVKKHAQKEGHAEFRVEGKFRPMVIIRKLPELRPGKQSFVVLPITSKGKTECGTARKGHFPIGKLVDYQVDSYVNTNDVQKLPVNMMCDCDGQVKIVQQLDPMTFSNILKIAGQFSRSIEAGRG